MSSRCGYVALVGRANAGKSTLLNAMVGQKVSGVSSKPQTTRNKILGICTLDDVQLLFLDTPGFHLPKASNRMGGHINREAWSSLSDANLVFYLIDVMEGWTDEDTKFVSKILKIGKSPLAILVSKIDRIKSDMVDRAALLINASMEMMISSLASDGVSNRLIYREPIYFSAKRPDDIFNLKQIASRQMPESEWLYPDDELTDRTQSFVCGELIRESVFRCLGEEIPYCSAVRIDAFEQKADITVIHASIVISKESQKGMVLGKNGVKIKEIGKHARQALERHLGVKVYLGLNVLVDRNWTFTDSLIEEYVQLNTSQTETKPFF
ncbi:MAG: GTPase Era [Oligoflexales bacterium]|nr:GTPase Era [Oligoflexales bacterium]